MSDQNEKPGEDGGREKSMIYTRTGDSGTSSLYSGERRKKSDNVFEALGDIDELNASLGVAGEFALECHDSMVERLSTIQSTLIDLMSSIATPLNDEGKNERKINRTRFSDVHTESIEAWIDEWDAKLPPLSCFILPSGGKCSAFLHVARGVCRRAERHVHTLVDDGKTEASVVRYLNRLSDFLFVAARFASFSEGRPELRYKKHAVTVVET
eukprot:TRINITY_DN4705_c0_g4_i4.p1 TRINITY_DN4705_c0_g4~~TRINITY_DN4705_c0_g4_i4.p1  ORF type:complete len:241 (-),score=61.84 TRINITY_DN4705_c0_g4_i4:35-670(-)